jgi:hypothetical protein
MAAIPFRKLVCHTIGTNFRQCTKIVSAEMGAKPAAGAVLIRNSICGINASDVNYTNAVYLPGVQPPFDTGFEAVGQVMACGDGVEKLKPGDNVVYSSFGAFTEVMSVDARLPLCDCCFRLWSADRVGGPCCMMQGGHPHSQARAGGPISRRKRPDGVHRPGQSG